MTPTPEQLEAVARAAYEHDRENSGYHEHNKPPPWHLSIAGQAPYTARAEMYWSIIAPLVRAATLEEAAVEVEWYRGGGNHTSERIRALKDRP